ncbi:hypothetical protein LOTGIDRAFT_141305 [Lottia gigantea]|uniref:Transporter n=1 Tax=Lottia gigantea TaxID=225164 RepID=V4A834_LOTGI|nr:hypothetical protein LOTGIDRAFT_141305 [Lottia gigantea]ESP00134.1 hypothetical protein LOTGIDRAFT_141305 [Lottia gigantea]
METPKRMQWKGKCDFILSLIGYGVGLGNIWRFPYLCAKNGGAVFLIPYAVFMVLVAFPLTFLELSLGQYSGKSAFGVWDICPAVRGIGLAMTGISVICCLYYNTILAWILYYLFNSFKSPLPWVGCDNWWNTDACFIQDISASTLHIMMNNTVDPYNTTKNHAPTEEFWNLNVLRISSGFEDIGSIQWHLVLALALAWLFIYICLFKGVESVGKVVYVTATMPYILITIILIRALTLPGAIDGVYFYIIPDFSKLGELQATMMQMFFSVGMGWGGFHTMASYNKFNNNILRDSIIYCVVGEGTSFYAGFAVFSILGHLSYLTNLHVSDLVRTGPGLAFIAYPEALATLPVPQLWTVLFFLMLLTTALDSMVIMICYLLFVILFCICYFVNKYFVFVICKSIFCICYIVGGIYVFQVVDWYVAAVTAFLVTIIECIVIGWIYGTERFYDDLEVMLGNRPSRIFKILWKFITPAILVTVLLTTLTQYTLPTYGDYQYPVSAGILGWFIALITALPIPIWMMKAIIESKGSLKEVSGKNKPPITPDTLVVCFLIDGTMAGFRRSAVLCCPLDP